MEHRMKLAAANRGKPFTEERKANISRGRTGVSPKPKSDAHREHLSTALKGRPPSAATLEASAAARRGKPLSDERKARLSEMLTGKKRPPRSPEHIAKLKAAAR